MILMDEVKRAFGEDGRGAVMRFLIDRELAGCGDDGERWSVLFEKCDGWVRDYLLWEDDTYIRGIEGWNFFIRVCCCRLPEEPADWTAYIYRMSLLTILRYDYYADEEGRNRVIENARNSSRWKDEYSCGFDVDYILESGYAELTREEWLEEINGFRRASWDKWHGKENEQTNNPKYIEEMEINYPKFAAITERLERETGDCQVARMNRQGGDETVWYFIKDQNSFYVLNIFDGW